MRATPSRAGALLSAFGWCAGLGAVLVVLPWWLGTTWGWPPPTGGLGIGPLPARGPLGGDGLVEAVVILAWVTWAYCALASVVELAQVTAGWRPRRLLGPAQGIAARAVGAAMLAKVLFQASTALPLASAPVVAVVSSAGAARLPEALAEAGEGPALAPSPGVLPVAMSVQRDEAPAATREYLVRHGDTLWGIAASQLGDPLRWREIASFNYHRPQPDGRELTDAHWIYPGWVLVLPVQADTPGTQARPAAASPDRLHTASPPGQALSSPTTTGAAEQPKEPVSPAQVVQLGTPSSAPPGDGGASPSMRGDPDATRGIGTDRPARRQPEHMPGLVFGALGAAGLLGALEMMRRAQQRHRRSGRRIRLPDGAAAEEERRLRAEAEPVLAELLDEALCRLAGALAASGAEAPVTLALHVGKDHVEVDVGPGQGEPPPGYRSWPGTWILPMGGQDDPSRRAPEQHPWPALIDLAHDTEGRSLIVNLEAAGTLGLFGAQEKVRGVLRAMAAQLAGAKRPWATELVLVGFDEALAPLQSHRSAEQLGPLLAELSQRRQSTDEALVTAGAVSPAAARLADGGETWAPLMVLCATPLDPEEAEAVIELGRPGGPVVVVAPALPRASWRLVLGEDSAMLEPLGLAFVPGALGDQDWSALSELLAVAADTTDVPAPEEASLAQPEHSGSSVDDGEPEPSADTDEEVAEGVTGVESTPLLVPSARSDEARAMPDDAVEDGLGQLPTAPEVAVLGPIELRGMATETDRPRVVELIAYLAMAKRPVEADTVSEALWGAASYGTLHTTIWAARRVLGTDADGRSLLPPMRGGGGLAVDGKVSTDWARFCALAKSDSPKAWHDALTLVRGRPFEGLQAQWIYDCQYVYEIESAVVDLAECLGKVCLDEGDASQARWAARQGLKVVLYDERLWRIALPAALLEGGQGAMEGVWKECCRAVLDAGVEPTQGLQPETVGLYRRLRASNGVDKGGSFDEVLVSNRTGDDDPVERLALGGPGQC